ncbi:MAG: hypothetical protein OEU26_00605 [Candidatus Tectomicrobia bacterium]|nr:hypothetical protein [Candidatus Tectomicrobia bacterium]
MSRYGVKAIEATRYRIIIGWDNPLQTMDTVTESNRKGGWRHTPQRTPGAIPHPVRRRKVSEDEIVIPEGNVPKGWVWRAWKERWSCPDLIPSEVYGGWTHGVI